MDSNNSDQEHVKYHHGGKRRGSGRKRPLDSCSSYKEVKFLLWKNISLHTSVYDDWNEMKKDRGFKDHSSFARFFIDSVSQIQQSPVAERKDER